MFKVGDIVYCIDNHLTCGVKLTPTLPFLKLDTSYTIKSLNCGSLMLNEIDRIHLSLRFISEKKYQISIRKRKINKIKECLK